MEELRNPVATIDEGAARLNAEASTLTAVVERQLASLRSVAGISKFAKFDADGGESAAQDEARRERHVALFDAMADQVASIRSAATELQRLAQERRRDRDPADVLY